MSPLSPTGGGLLTVVLFSASGWALTSLVPRLRRLPVLPRWGYGYLLGLAWTCGGLYAVSHLFGASLRLPAILALAATPLPALLWRHPRQDRRRFLHRLRAIPPGILLPTLAALVFGGAVTLTLMAHAVAWPETDWDGRMTWSLQGHYLWDAGTVNAPVLAGRRWSVSHPQYPVLMPLAQAVALEVTGSDEDDRATRPLYAAFFPAFLAILYDASRRWLGRRTAGWVALVAANVPLLAFAGEGGATSNYSDLPLACFYGAALLLLLARPRLPEGLAAGLLLAATVLAKNEGAPLALVVLGLGLWSALRRGRSQGRRDRRRALLRAALPAVAAALVAVAALGLLASWRGQIPNREDEMYLASLDVRQLAADLVPHLRTGAPVALEQMLSASAWGLFWPCALVLALAGARGLRRPPALRLALAAAAALGVAFLAYTAHGDPAYLVRVTWNRMILHAALPLFLLFGMCLRSIFPRSSFPRGAPGSGALPDQPYCASGAPSSGSSPSKAWQMSRTVLWVGRISRHLRTRSW